MIGWALCFAFLFVASCAWMVWAVYEAVFEIVDDRAKGRAYAAWYSIGAVVSGFAAVNAFGGFVRVIGGTL